MKKAKSQKTRDTQVKVGLLSVLLVLLLIVIVLSNATILNSVFLKEHIDVPTAEESRNALERNGELLKILQDLNDKIPGKADKDFEGRLKDIMSSLIKEQSKEIHDIIKSVVLEHTATRDNQENIDTNTVTVLDYNALYYQFNKTVVENVKWNNWFMGCNDLAIAASYYRAVFDRLRTKHRVQGKKQLIFDIGANNGQDAATIFGAFHRVEGMCANINHIDYMLIAVEPSPKVFCELKRVIKKKAWDEDHATNVYFLNIALSDVSGNLKFLDTGNEDGKLLSSEQTNSKDLMSSTDFNTIQNCQEESTPNQGDNSVQDERMPIQEENVSIVKTYTFDLLVESLEKLNIVTEQDNVFLIKVDAEGHDFKVLKGAQNLFQQKRVTFVLFEASSNGMVKEIVEFMKPRGYLCFLFTPSQMVPIEVDKWWYNHLDEFQRSWW